MSGERIDYSIERRRHEKFLGRAALLARLDQLLIESDTDRSVVIIGGPGMGKSALLAAWLAWCQAAGAVVPHHFIRRGMYDWDDPRKLVGSLVAQIEDGFPELRERDGDDRLHPAIRLAQALSRVSEHVLLPRGERLVIVIDGLDEYDPPTGASAGHPPAAAAGDPLAAFLPEVLPAGVRLLCASRPRHPYVSSLETRDAVLERIDLDDPVHARDNDATVRAFWTVAAQPLGLDAAFVEDAVARAGGCVQHAVQLRKHLAALPPEQRRVEDIPRGLAALIAKAWERIATDASVVDALGILCAAHEALTLDELGAVAGWTADVQRRGFLRAAKELLVEAARPGESPEYRLHHDSIRGHIAQTIGDVALRVYHRALARRHAAWPAPGSMAARRYALRYALLHRAEAGDWEDAWHLATDMSWIKAKCREVGVRETELDVARVAERCRASGDGVRSGRFRDLARALVRESHWLRAAPEAAPALIWNRLRRLGWSAGDLDGQLRGSTPSSFLRVRHAITRESPALLRDLTDHSGVIAACAVTPDGQRVVSASVDQTLKVWDFESGRSLATLQGHTDWVSACLVTPDGRRVVSASYDETLKVWDLDTGRPLATLQGHTRGVLACAVTPDSRRVVSASYDETLKVWDLDTGRPLATLQGHTDWVRACAVTPDGQRVISASDDRTLRVWDLDTGRLLATLQGHADAVTACAVTPDGRRVVSASVDRTLKVWDLETGRPLATLQGHDNWVSACAVTPDGRRVVSASYDQTLKVWDLETGRPLATLQGHDNWVSACAVTPDGRRVVSASWDQTLKVWDLDARRPLATLQGHTDWVNACLVTPDDRRVVSTSVDMTLKVWDPATGRPLATLQGHAEAVTGCAMTPDGRRIVSASDDQTLKVWDLDSGRLLATLRGHTDWVRACAVTPDGRCVVSGSDDKTMKVWDLDSGRLLATLQGHAERVSACAVTPDGRRVVSASNDQTLKVWDLDSGRPLTTLQGHTAWVRACAVTPDGRRMVSASYDKTLKVWDLDTGRLLATLQGHAAGVFACAVTPDGRRVVSASVDQTLKVWDLESFTCLLTHRGDTPYSALAITATTIVAGDTGGGLWFLDWPPSTHHPERRLAVGTNTGRRRSRSGSRDAPPRPVRPEHTILFLAANPRGTDWLALEQEARAIQVELERSGHRDRFDFVTRWAAEPLDLLRELRRLEPTVVHFSGHGGLGTATNPSASTGPRGDVVSAGDEHLAEQQHVLFFHGPDGRAQSVSTAAIAQAVEAAGASVQLVVLNACYSEAHADALLAHVDCVVGMDAAVRDDAARLFAVGFYGGLGDGESVAAAYKQGRAAIALLGLPDGDRPQLKTRTGVDADRLVLAADHDATRQVATAAPERASPARADVGILTLHDNEFCAVLDAFPSKAGVFKSKREYTLRHADAGHGERYVVAVLRPVERGTGEVLDTARDLIDDLAPRLVLVVGIAGGLPSDDVQLGDVILATWIHDFTVETPRTGRRVTFAASSGPINTVLAAAVANLAGRDDDLGDWTADLPPPPPVEWTRKGQLYGPKAWQNELRAKLEHHHGERAAPRKPRYVVGPIASSDRLVKDPKLLFPWITTARNVLAVELESGGVHRAVRERCPILTIRGISDIVGLQRADGWTKFACASAAAFARAFLRTRPVELDFPTAGADELQADREANGATSHQARRRV